MLRVRPIVYTPQAAEWNQFLAVLGLERFEVAGRGAALALGTGIGSCFAAGAGRVLVREAESFGIGLGFEVRDVQRFAEWTIGDGTPVTLRGEASVDGPVNIAHMVAPDGTEFDARPVDPAILAGTPAALRPAAGAHPPPLAASPLSVVAQWHTDDVPGACSTLENIGAKPTSPHAAGSRAGYRAKHGGFIDVFENSLPHIDLAFEYAGSTLALAEDMATAGYQVLAPGAGEQPAGDGSTVFVGHPDGGRIQVACTFRDGE